ncbi:MAG: hypothetical protein BWX70_03221 [Verrucomicrobia bacterium ADurb.Bin070]|nr:MAG: hypothetical protein BWX70_03221 [Verrucomicrobia bacterium ADurb.Bin070]
MARHIRHADARAGVEGDKLQRAHHHAVADLHRLGRAPRHDAQRPVRDGRTFADRATHEAVQHLRGLVAGALGIKQDARHRRLGGLAEVLVIVHAQHRDLVRHRDAGARAGVQNLPPAIVHRRQQGHRLGQVAQPGAEPTAFKAGVLLLRMRKVPVQMAIKASLAHGLGERGTARDRPLQAVDLAHVGEVRELPREEICRRHAPDGGGVAFDHAVARERLPRAQQRRRGIHHHQRQTRA